MPMAPADKINDHGYRKGVQFMVAAMIAEAAQSKNNPMVDMREIITEWVSPETDISDIVPGEAPSRPLSPEEHLYAMADAFAVAIMLAAGKRVA